MLSKLSRSLVACNIYVSAGGHPSHRDVLVGLLSETQELCRIANQSEKNNCPKSTDRGVVVVHAFRDGPYDRSSFHLAGSPDLVADVGSSLATRAVRALLQYDPMKDSDETIEKSIDSNPRRLYKTDSIGKRHPTVGLVDHVSVLPLVSNKSSINEDDLNIADIASSVARTIGENLESSGARVLYYGHAHPSGKDLAAVRRDETPFFNNDKLITVEANDSANTNVSTNRIHKPAGQATVGAPFRFVENYNIRLRPNVPKEVARTLTKSIRERGGQGLPFVEALTLVYGRDQYEIACNLLDPLVTPARKVEERMKEWECNQIQKHKEYASGLVQTTYRVGTTNDMCLESLQELFIEGGERAHNRQVLERLVNDFLHD